MSRPWITLRGRDGSNNPPRIEILKVDVESLETSVIFGAEQLIKARLIRNLFMEWTITRLARRQERPRRAMQILLDAGYTLCGWGGFLGPKLENLGWDATDREHFFENKNRKSAAMNVWWQSEPTCPYGRRQ